MTQVVSIVGARPQFVKLSPMAQAFGALHIDHRIVHTGQHYDSRMSDAFFVELGIPEPDVNLGAGSGSHAAQTAVMLTGIEAVLSELSPDLVLLYGDTNSTLAGAIVASKMGLRSAHLEAGLRSWNRAMPEEVNRVVTDHCVDLCLAPSDTAVKNLAEEGLAHRTVQVGDVMVDSTLLAAERNLAAAPDMPFDHSESFVLCTLHRPSNVDDPRRLAHVLEALASVPMRVVLAAHPRLQQALEGLPGRHRPRRVEVVRPLSYREMIFALQRSHSVVTDSGGLQKEAFTLGVPCTTVRAETEWVETLSQGWNILDHACTDIARLATRCRPTVERAWPYGTGNAAMLAAEAMLSDLSTACEE